jgi:hypothetical protein
MEPSVQVARLTCKGLISVIVMLLSRTEEAEQPRAWQMELLC